MRRSKSFVTPRGLAIGGAAVIPLCRCPCGASVLQRGVGGDSLKGVREGGWLAAAPPMLKIHEANINSLLQLEASNVHSIPYTVGHAMLGARQRADGYRSMGYGGLCIDKGAAKALIANGYRVHFDNRYQDRPHRS